MGTCVDSGAQLAEARPWRLPPGQDSSSLHKGMWKMDKSQTIQGNVPPQADHSELFDLSLFEVKTVPFSHFLFDLITCTLACQKMSIPYLFW
jgi:hypothetical protein